MNTTKTLAGAAMAALLMTACGKFNRAESVCDLGFEVTAETAFSSDHLCNTLSLTLESGTEGEYTLNYVIDNDHTLELSSLRGGSLESGDKIDLSLKNPQVLLLPKTAGGTGTLVMEFVREGVSRKKAVVFRTENAVTVSPSGPDAFPIRYLYKGTTWWHSANKAARCAGKGLLVYGAGFQRHSVRKTGFSGTERIFGARPPSGVRDAFSRALLPLFK